MIKVGDVVKHKRTLFYTDWYSTETYVVIDIRIEVNGSIVVTLDRNFPPDKLRKQHTEISISNIELDVKYIREKKIKNIFDD